MAKDPAALFFIDKWLVATKEMKADCRGWYLNLVMHQFDKKDLPNDIEELANLCDVRISEFEHFKQVFEQVLKHKFKENSRGRLENEYAKEIITDREKFKEKRSNAGKISYFSKFMRKTCKDENLIRFVIQRTDFDKLDTKNEQMLEQVFKQTSKLFINEIENEIVNKDIITITIEDEVNLVNAAKKILTDFGFNEISGMNKLRQIKEALNHIFTTGRIEYFMEQYENYMIYKKQKKERVHGLENFFDFDNQFENPGWDSNTWSLLIIQTAPTDKMTATVNAFAKAENPFRK